MMPTKSFKELVQKHVAEDPAFAEALRAALDAAEAEGGSFSTDDVRRYAREHLDALGKTRKGS
jgi:hypothetical protein